MEVCASCFSVACSARCRCPHRTDPWTVSLTFERATFRCTLHVDSPTRARHPHIPALVVARNSRLPRVCRSLLLYSTHGLLYGQALLKALALRYARDDLLLAVSAAGCTWTAWAASPERPARAWDAHRPRHCMCACMACTRVFCRARVFRGAETASAWGYR